ncbi:hypothetical protein M9458_004733, partial [Cirrhinus mrigala]
NAELSETCETEEGSSESVESVSSECTEHSNTRNRKEKTANAPVQKLTNAVNPAFGTHEDDAVNTSDEEHEELPYDGAQSNSQTEMNLKPSPCETVKEIPRQNFTTLDKFSMPIGNAEQTEACKSNLTHGLPSNHKAINNLPPPSATPVQPADHITDFLLRHFSKEELLNSSRIIEAETLPEMSLMDSIDETVLSRASQPPQILKKIQDVMEEPDPSIAESHGLVELNISNESSSSKEPGTTCITDTASAVDDDKDDDNKESLKRNSLDLSKADAQKPKCSFSRTRSYSELKYGQGKVHYPLPDFSKVAPKVKIPKGNANFKPLSQSPGMARAQSSPGIL